MLCATPDCVMSARNRATISPARTSTGDTPCRSGLGFGDSAIPCRASSPAGVFAAREGSPLKMPATDDSPSRAASTPARANWPSPDALPAWPRPDWSIAAASDAWLSCLLVPQSSPSSASSVFSNAKWTCLYRKLQAVNKWRKVRWSAGISILRIWSLILDAASRSHAAAAAIIKTLNAHVSILIPRCIIPLRQSPAARTSPTLAYALRSAMNEWRFGCSPLSTIWRMVSSTRSTARCASSFE
mmetsp:Transcript_17355/g.42892  ORF Transcript_17355/g.42892 Transcript_17355/m.42892 type:complete len:243 (-) Transcript_17355:1764-2492(-)